MICILDDPNWTTNILKELFELNEEVPVRGYLSGYQMGTYTGYATNQEEFLDQLEEVLQVLYVYIYHFI